MTAHGLRALMIHHERNSPAGLVGARLEERDVEIDHVQIGETYEPGPDTLPDLDDYDLVVTMGSIASVTAAERVDWILDELRFLAAADAVGVPILGVCFGGQSLAAALGGAVEPCPIPEIGWYPIDTDVPEISPGPWLAWHVDRFIPPNDATELARTSSCAHAFRLRRNLGVQFHPEVEETTVEHWAATAAAIGGSYGLDVSPVLRNLAAHVAAARVNTARLVDFFLDDVAAVESAQSIGANSIRLRTATSR